MKQFLQVFLYSWVFLSIANAQTYTGKTIKLDADNPEYATENGLFKARDFVSLLPGFSFAANTNHEFRAYIDETLVCDVDYLTGSAIPDIGTREINKSLPVGSTNGVFNVSGTGAATYTLPVFSPPGTAGVQPSVSINYSSQSGNGLLGMGWHIGGLSVISRVPQTIYHDGYNNGVDLSSDDRFALDGNRLITTGTYGGNGTTYKTESHNFATITSFDANGNNTPEKFTVESKDGTVIEYGGNARHQVNNGSYQTVAWYINKITDANGNYIRYYYYNNATNGEFRISRIEYTGNETAGLNPYNKITFLYETRTADKQTNYINGYTIKQNVILRGIKVVAEGGLVRKYEFKYSSSFYTHLSEIIEYDASGNRFNSTIVNWGAETPEYNAFSTIINTDEPSNYYTLDINNDGKTDIVRYPKLNIAGTPEKKYKVYHTNSNGTNFTLSQTIDYGFVNRNTYITTHVGDFNGDGFQDMLAERVGRNNAGEINGFRFDLFSSNGILFNSIKKDKIYQHEDGHPKTNSYFSSTGDFNGDGITDVVSIQYPAAIPEINGIKYYRHHVRLYIGSVNSTFTKHTYHLISGTENHGIKKLIVRDFNHDGNSDLLFLMDNGYRLYTNTYNGDNSGNTGIHFSYGNSITQSNFNYKHFIKVGDFNGDGNKDLITYHNTTGWKIRYFNGKEFISPVNSPVTLFTNPDERTSISCNIADYNGDGKDDIWEAFNIYEGGGTSGSVIDIGVNMYYSIGYNSFYAEGISELFDGSVSGLHKSSSKNLVDFNGDGKADMFYKKIPVDANPAYIVSFHRNEKKHLVNHIANGLNHKTYISYKPLSSGGTFYTKGTAENYPINNIQGSLHAVNYIRTPNGIGGMQLNHYEYEGARIHKQGKGFLGFSKLTVRNSTTQNKIETITKIDITNFLLKQQITKTYYSNNQPQSLIINNYAYHSKGDKSFFNYLDNSSSTDYLTNVTTGIDNTYNSSGYLTESEISPPDMYSRTEYSSFTSRGKPQAITVTNRHADDASTFVDKTLISYDSKGNITSKTAQYLKPNTVKTTYSSFNNFGQARVVSTTSTGLPTTTASISFDSKGRFITSKTTNIGTESYTHDAGTGKVLSLTDMLNNKTTYTYGAFGKLVSTTYPTSVIASASLNWAGGEGPQSSALYYSKVSQTNSPDVYSYSDILGRNVLSTSTGFNNIAISNSNKFLSNGKLKKSTSKVGSNETYTSYTYYPDGRLHTQTPSIGASVTQAYSNLTQTTTITRTGADNQTFSKVFDNAGNVKSATDEGGTIRYKYFSHGGLKSTTVHGNITSVGYDQYGRQNSLNDPNAGTSTYKYNAYGQLESQSDAKGNTFTSKYDNQGRLEYKEDKNGGKTIYSYYSNGNGNGLIKEVLAPDGIMKNEYSYGLFGRLSSETETIETGKEFITSYKYASSGAISQVKYPSGIVIDYIYDNKGNLTELLHKGKSIWKLITQNTEKLEYQLNNNTLTTSYEYGTNKTLEAISTKKGANVLYKMEFGFNSSTNNLDNRKNTTHNLYESFEFDKLNRLTDIAGPSSLNQVFNYDGALGNTMGNITKKTDVADLFLYNSSRPHAVVKLENTSTKINTLQNTQSITYNDFNAISSISEGIHSMSFEYGTDEMRKKVVYNKNNSEEWIRYYGNSYERTEFANGNTKEVTYISAGNGLIATYIENNDSGGEWYFTLKDHLGSIIAMVNESGLIVEEYSYDAWGRRRNPNNWTYTDITTPTLLDRGYTGHEHLDMFNIINMNGRIYDPLLGRFLSPDNNVQSPDYTQNYNRYAYCLNNPLIYTDPSGEIFVAAWLLFTESGYEAQKYVSPVAVHVDVKLSGKSQTGLGYDVSLGVPKSTPVSYRYNFGQTYYSKTYGGHSGRETRKGGEWTLFGVVNYSGTTFSGADYPREQTTNMITYGGPFENLKYENDTYLGNYKLPGVPQGDPNSDGYRTASARIKVGPLKMGMILHTGYTPDVFGLQQHTDTDGDGVNDTWIMSGGDIQSESQSHGIFYVGFGPLRIGRDTEKNRQRFQNDWAHDRFNGGNNGSEYPWVRTFPDRDPRWYFQFWGGTGSTLY